MAHGWFSHVGMQGWPNLVLALLMPGFFAQQEEEKKSKEKKKEEAVRQAKLELQAKEEAEKQRKREEEEAERLAKHEQAKAAVCPLTLEDTHGLLLIAI